MLLLRLKHADARTLLEAARALVAALPIPVLVSERLDVALASGAAGVHLSATSMPVVAVRLQAPAGFLIGGSVSEANDLPRVVGADFVTIGPVFGSGDQTLGLEAFTRLARAAGVPAIAVGAVDSSSAAECFRAGAAGVAVIREVSGADDVEGAARLLAAQCPPPSSG